MESFLCGFLILCFVFIKGSFVVDVTQSSYQAEENHNITLEWTFTTKPDTSISALKIFCYLIADQKPLTLYYLRDGVEFSEVQDKRFSGRVQSDKDALREGRIRLQLSRLRTEDSGLYLCEVDTGYGRGYNSCRVSVSEAQSVATETTQPPRIIQTSDVNKETKVKASGKVWTGLIIAVVVVCVVLILLIVVVSRCKKRSDSSSHTEVLKVRVKSREVLEAADQTVQMNC